MSTEATFSAKVNFDFEKWTIGESLGPVIVTVAWNSLVMYLINVTGTIQKNTIFLQKEGHTRLNIMYYKQKRKTGMNQNFD